MGRRQRFITALCAGRGAASGKIRSGSLLGTDGSTDTQMIDSTHVKAHRSAAGGKGGSRNRLLAARAEGETLKIHALADAKGRLLAILLTGGEAHDCPIAERLIRRVKRAKRMLGDKAYDSAELREELDERGTKPVIPNRCNRKQPFSFSKRLYKLRWRHRACVQQTEGLQAHRNPIRQAGAK